MPIAYRVAVKFTFSTDKGAFEYPGLPVLGAVFGFFLISFVLPRFVFYIADSINLASIARDIARRTVRGIGDLYGKAPWKPGDPILYSRPDPEHKAFELDKSEFELTEHQERVRRYKLRFFETVEQKS